MADIKHHFRRGRMNKDLDERIVPNGEYRDAQNIEIITSEGSNVGSVQNVLGNTLKDGRSFDNSTSLLTNWGSSSSSIKDLTNPKCIGYVADPQNNKVYWFISSEATATAQVNGASTDNTPVLDNNSGTIVVGMKAFGGGVVGTTTVTTVTDQNNITLSNNTTLADNTLLTFKLIISCIAEFDTLTGEISPVLVDKNNILKYSTTYPIISANVLNGLLLWTDNQTEPKKIKISKFKQGSSTFNYHTQLNNSDFTEKDITVIKQSPLKAPTLTMSSTERTQSSFGILGGTPISVKQDFYSSGSALTQGSLINLNFRPKANFIKNDIIVLQHNSSDNTEETKYEITLKIIGLINSEIITDGYVDSNTYSAQCSIQTIPLDLPDLGSVDWTATLEEKDPLFKEVFVRFAYRWKYKEGEYSTFSPFSEVAFLPSKFLYENDDGNNLGMINSLRTLALSDFDTQPEEVEFVEILLKDSVSNSVYVIDTLKSRETTYSVNSENFGFVLESNQLLRPYDNVPKKAKTQEIIANRLVFANYLQGYDLIKQNVPDVEASVNQTSSDKKTTATVLNSNIGANNIVTLSAENNLIEKGMLVTGDGVGESTFVKSILGTQLELEGKITPSFKKLIKTGDGYVFYNSFIPQNTVLTFSLSTTPQKSVKSLRNYQIGATYSDIYGRETPVFSSNNSSIRLPKIFGKSKNTIVAELKNNAPTWATHYKFFVKETSSEYYNIPLDKFYFSEDGNIWLSFPSSERNKVDEETYLILKKKHDGNDFVSEEARYKILDISNEAPNFISEELLSKGKAVCTTLSNNQPTVGSNFFKFNGPEATKNPSFTESFISGNQIQISTDIPDRKNPTAKVNGLISNKLELLVDNNVGTIRVGDTVTGTGISGDVTVKEVVSQTSLVLSSRQSIADNVDLTFLAAPAKISRKYEILNGGLSSSGNTYEVELVNPLDETDSRVFSSTLVSENSEIQITIFSKEIKPKAEFFGRFFVKINRDFILDKNIIEAFPSITSSYEDFRSEKIFLNIPNDFSDSELGEEKPKQDLAWGDTFEDEFTPVSVLNGVATTTFSESHPETGSKFFKFYYAGIDINKVNTLEDDLTINVNSFITEITKPGALIRFSNENGEKGEVYEVTGSSVTSEFRSSEFYKKRLISGKRRLYKVFIKNHETGQLYDDPFNKNVVSSEQLGRINKISLIRKNVKINDEKISSDNPAIFETEPKTSEGLDIYHEASDALPIIKAGMTVTGTNVGSGNSNIVSSVVDGSNIELLNNTNGTMSSGTTLTFTDEKNIYSFTVTTSGDVSTATSVVLADNQVHGQKNSLNWFNCFSFGNGVESNRIKDDFNAPFIDKGPIVSTTIDTDYKEEQKTNSFIFSGIFNSISGINELNQFIQALPITKDINPEYGTIQKIFSRDADLITFCEDKVLKILANKDALFNADGNTNLTATNRVLGQAMPYVGEYGISQNPESFASHAFRIYFSDKARGAVLRLSRDGLTEISSKGMTDFFRDNLASSSDVIGSYDENRGSYNITLNNQTLSFDERVDGWTSFKSFIPEAGFSLNNIYYTYKNGDLYSHDNTVRNTFYGTAYASSIKFIFNDFPQSVKSFKTLNYEGSDSRKYTYGRDATSGDYHSKAHTIGSSSITDGQTTVEINNIFLSSTSTATDAHISIGDIVEKDDGSGLGTIVSITDGGTNAGTEKTIVLSNPNTISNDTNINFKPAYGAGTKLEFIKKEGLTPNTISTLVETETKGWFADSITTDQQTGSVRFFKEKENFKFNQILGDNTTSSNIDTKEFSIQGLGIPSTVGDNGINTHTLNVVDSNDGDLDNATLDTSTVTYTDLTHDAQVGSSLSNSVFTITPNAGFVVSASDFSASGVATDDSNKLQGGVISSITNSGTAGTVGNTVIVTVDILDTLALAQSTTINIDIRGTAKPLKYTVTGTFSTDEKNTTTSSLYNFGYSGTGDYYLNARVNGLSTDSSPVLHPEKSALMQTAASSTTSLVLDNIFNNEIISVGDTITGTGVTTVTAKVNGNVSDSSTVNVDNNSGTIVSGMVVTGGGISELITVTNASSQSAPVLSKNVTLSDNEDLNFGVAISSKDTQFATTSDGDQASVGVTNAQTISNNAAISISSNKIFENMAIIGSGVPDNALVKSINFTALNIKDGTGADLSATIPDDTILRFGTEIISKTFTADAGFEFRSAPTLDVIDQDESTFSEYTSSNDFVSTTATVNESNIVRNNINVVLTGSNDLIAVGMVVTGNGISSNTKVASISGVNLTLDTAATISGSTVLSFFPSVVTLKVYYVFSTNNPTEDTLLLTAHATPAFLDVPNEITGMQMSKTTIGGKGETRFIRVFGKEGAKFRLKRFTTGIAQAAYSNKTNIVLEEANSSLIDEALVQGPTVPAGTTVSSVELNSSFTDATCDYSSGDATVTHDDDNGKIKAGMFVVADNTNDGLDNKVVVASVTSDTVFELSANPVASRTNETLTFVANTIITTSKPITTDEGEILKFNSFWNGKNFVSSGTLSQPIDLTIPNTGVYSIPIQYPSTSVARTFNYEVEKLEETSLATDFNGDNPVSVDQSIKSTWTITSTPFSNSDDSADITVTGISFSRPKELSKSAITNFSMTLTTDGTKFLSEQRQPEPDDFQFSPDTRTVSSVGTLTIGFTETLRVGNIVAGSLTHTNAYLKQSSVRSIISGGSKNGGISVSDKITGRQNSSGTGFEAIIADNSVNLANFTPVSDFVAVGDIITFNPPNEWEVEYSNIKGNIGTTTDVYTLTGTLNIKKYGSQNVTSTLDWSKFLNITADGGTPSASSSSSILLQGLIDEANSNANITKVKLDKKLIAIGLADNQTVAGSGRVFFEGNGNTQNQTTVALSVSSHFDNSSISNVQFVNPDGTNMSASEPSPVVGVQEVKFDYDMLTNTAVELGDDLSISISVTVSNPE